VGYRDGFAVEALGCGYERRRVCASRIREPYPELYGGLDGVGLDFLLQGPCRAFLKILPWSWLTRWVSRLLGFSLEVAEAWIDDLAFSL